MPNIPNSLGNPDHQRISVVGASHPVIASN
jgi:hypothetical protein